MDKKYTSFIDDKEKMIDFIHLSKADFLASYSYLTEEEYNLTMNDYFDALEDRTGKYDYLFEDIDELDNIKYEEWEH